MSNIPPGEITRLLAGWRDGDSAALEKLAATVYSELRQLARSYLQREQNGHTLETRALIHEVYLRLVGQEHETWTSRQHFFGIASRTMRHILVEHARRRQSKKRGGGVRPIEFDEAILLPGQGRTDLVALDEALQALAQTDPEKSELVELRFFGGLGHAEIAELRGVSVSTVDRQWRLVRSWLYDVLRSDMA